MLGAKGMSAEQCLQKYEEVARDAFSESMPNASLPEWLKPRLVCFTWLRLGFDVRLLAAVLITLLALFLVLRVWAQRRLDSWLVVVAVLLGIMSQVSIQPGASYSAQPLENRLKKLFGNATLSDHAHTRFAVMSTIWSEEPRSRVAFRSYDIAPNHTLRAPRAARNRIKLWEVGRATSAAYTFFDPITIGNQTFIDGGHQVSKK